MSKKLSEQYLIELNFHLIENYSPQEIKGVKDMKLLSSAVHAPFQSMFGAYLHPDIFDKAVALMTYVAKNHPFHNGNKRTAVMAMVHFLFVNGHMCVMKDSDLADLVVNVVTNKLSHDEAVRIVKSKCYRK